MATTWSTLYKRACRRYGLNPLVEHDLLVQPLFLDRLNEVLAEMAEAGGFREEFTIDLSGSSAVHSLSARVLSIVPGTLRVDYTGSGSYLTEPRFVDEQELRQLYGPLENEDAATPLYYYLQRGSAADQLLQLVLFPRSDTARTNGIKFWGQTVPSAITAVTANVPVQQAEERVLMSGICVALAEAEANPNKLAIWEPRWRQALATYVDQIEDGLSDGHRRIHYVPYELDFA